MGASHAPRHDDSRETAAAVLDGSAGLRQWPLLPRAFREAPAWKETRSVVDVLFYADHNLKRHFSDDQLRTWFAQLKQWNLKFALEVGAVSPGAYDR